MTAPEFPIVLSVPLFIDRFLHKGELPHAETIGSEWLVESGTFTSSKEDKLLVTSPGQLVYQGTSLNNLQRIASVNANYVIVARFVGQENMKLEIRGRRADNDNYIAFGLDFEEQHVYMEGISGIAGFDRIYVNHTFTVDKQYNIQLWMLDEMLLGVINNGLLIHKQYDQNKTNHGFSISVPDIVNDPIFLFAIGVFELKPPVIPGEVVDGSDQLLNYRQQIKEEIENPSDKNWDTFKRAHYSWDWHRNLGHMDIGWQDLGYKIRRPYTEDWFAIEDPYL